MLCDRCLRGCNEVRQNFVIARNGKGYGAHSGFDLGVPLGESSCVECGANVLVGFSPRAGGAVCRAHAQGSLALSCDGLAGIELLLSAPLADAARAEVTDRARRDALAVVTSSYEEHGGFRLRTLSA